MKKWNVMILAACLSFSCLAGCRSERKQADGELQSLQPATIEEVSVKIPGMEGSKSFLYLSDLHLIKESDQVAESELETVRGRIGWSSFEGVSAADSWPKWVESLNGEETDGILFGGDMVDFASKANVECLKAGLDQLTHSYMYVRADHDTAPFYLGDVTNEESMRYQNTIAPNDEVMEWEYDDFLIVGWNNSTDNLTSEGLEQMRGLFAKGKPVILLTHVPIKSIVDESLSQASKEAWGDRELLWGFGCYHYPDENTVALLQMIYAEDTPVVEILSGHVHFTWDGHVTEQVHEHVFSATFERYMGVITVSGQ